MFIHVYICAPNVYLCPQNYYCIWNQAPPSTRKTGDKEGGSWPYINIKSLYGLNIHLWNKDPLFHTRKFLMHSSGWVDAFTFMSWRRHGIQEKMEEMGIPWLGHECQKHHVYIHMYICKHICIKHHENILMYIYTYKYTYIYTHVYIYVCIYIHAWIK